MPARKKNARAAQHQPQPILSDYDTDTNITDNAASTAPPPARTNTELNLLVLRRYVPETERIISIAPFAVLYTFSPETQLWEKSGTEGTLFVCQLSGSQHPRYNVVILNRKSLENFVMDLLSEEDIEITEQYVILQGTGEDGIPIIYGLWIFSDESDGAHKTKDIVASAIQECAMRAAHHNFTGDANDQDDVEPPAPYNPDDDADNYTQVSQPVAQPQSAGQSIDLLSLFSKGAAPSMPDHLNGQTRIQSNGNDIPNHIPSFPSTADTDFFRSTRSHASPAPTQPQPPPQQNALLDLFNSARNG